MIEALEKIYKALKMGGKVYIITVSPFSESWEIIKPAFEEHQRLFQPNLLWFQIYGKFCRKLAYFYRNPSNYSIRRLEKFIGTNGV